MSPSHDPDRAHLAASFVEERRNVAAVAHVPDLGIVVQGSEGDVGFLLMDYVLKVSKISGIWI